MRISTTECIYDSSGTICFSCHGNQRNKLYIRISWKVIVGHVQTHFKFALPTHIYIYIYIYVVHLRIQGRMQLLNKEG